MQEVLSESSSIATVTWFEQGNYVMAAWKGDRNLWQTYAAMALIGKTKEAIEALNQFDHSEARFYQAVAHWMDGEDDAAAIMLSEIDIPHARNLFALIKKPSIEVLAQLPWSPPSGSRALTGAPYDPKFRIRNISFEPGDLPNEPYADIRNFYDRQTPPDFYVCSMIEWQMIPPSLQSLPCPIFGATSDYDIHIQVLQPWLPLFDEVIVAEQTEWDALRKLTKTPVCTFPKAFGYCKTMPPLCEGIRDIDVFQSGTIHHPYHPEKARLFHEVFRMSGINLVSIIGFLTEDRYYDFLSRAKMCFTYIRHPGGMAGRAVEALCAGSVALVQQECVMQLYLGEEHGVVAYDGTEQGLAASIRRVLSQWPSFQQHAHCGARIAREEFALDRVVPQYLRFLTFLAAKPRLSRLMAPTDRLMQRRNILWKGKLVGTTAGLQRLRADNFARWQPKLPNETSPHLGIDLARELVLEYASEPDGDASKFTKAITLYHQEIKRFPRCLVLRLNCIRASLHLGSPAEVKAAIRLAEDTLSSAQDRWLVDAMENVFPWDFFPMWFNYRSYLDLVSTHHETGDDVATKLTNLISASLHHYVGVAQNNLEFLRKSIQLDPDFPSYQLSLAKAFITSGSKADQAEAASILRSLASGSILFLDAYRLLKGLKPNAEDVQTQTLGGVMDRIIRHSLVTEKTEMGELQPSTVFSRQLLHKLKSRSRSLVFQTLRSLVGDRYYTGLKEFRRTRRLNRLT